MGTEAQRPAEVQDALYRIAELASAAHDMSEFYAAVHAVVGELMYAQNFAIILYDDERQRISWPYIVDERGAEYELPAAEWEAIGEGIARGVVGYVIRIGVPQLLDYGRFLELLEHGDVEETGSAASEGLSWLGVPLKDEGRTVGVLVVQSYTSEHRYTEQDKDLLAFVGQHIGAALSRARAIEETRQRNAELALINSVQDAIAGELDEQAIYDVVGDKIQEIFDAQVVDIAMYDFSAGLTRYTYVLERGVRFPQDPVAMGASPITQVLLETKAPVLINDIPAWERKQGEVPVAQGEASLAILAVPLVSGDEVRGRISLQNLDRTSAFSEGDVRLLSTLAGSLSVALENARLVHETRQRNAELALINEVQAAIAGELDMQAIYDVVGDKIGEIFDAQGVSINVFDETTGLTYFPYLVERGERLEAPPQSAPGGFTRHVLETREPLLINEDLAAEVERYGSLLVAGEMEKSMLLVPLVTGERAGGAIALSNFDREHAFGDADQRLLTTLAGSLSAALENARLVHETRQRNAELALINDVQAAIAGELDQQAIFDSVGDRIQEIFDAQVVAITTLDKADGLLRFPYIRERGARLEAEPRAAAGFSKHVIDTGEPLLIVENALAEAENYGSGVVVGEWPKSLLFVPLVTGTTVGGTISLQNVDREHAFDESDQQLLETLAGSLSVALENARLVHETRQRNAELALINSVQEAIAGELDSQAIYDAVGDRIKEIFDVEQLYIAILDGTTQLIEFPYFIERAERSSPEPRPLGGGISTHVLETGEPLLINENLEEAVERYGSGALGAELPKSVLFVPLEAGGRAFGVVCLGSFREHAFTDSDQQLLETLAGSLSVALENARLVHETRQRNAELALINSVQDAIAGELDSQAIYDAVGDRIQEIFDAQVVSIITLDATTGLVHFTYIMERGERLQAEPRTAAGFSKHVLETRESLLIVENALAEAENYGSAVVAGEEVKSLLFVPLITSGEAAGVISLQNIDREHAFGESDRQLLETLAGSLSVALENARLVHETRQRNAELALINGVQEAIAGELDSQAIYDAVGDRIQEIFDAQAVSIETLDEATGLLHYPYIIERGERLQAEPSLPGGFSKHVQETREPLLIAENMDEELERYGSTILAGEAAKSLLYVPLVSGGKVAGAISLQNVDREHAFGESDQQLLTTLAGSLSVALENARLVHETRQRNAELALINGVQEAIAGELDSQAIYEAVGERIRDVFDAHTMTISRLDESSGLVHHAYIIERGERLHAEPTPPRGFSKHVLETRESLLIVEELEGAAERYGSVILAGEWPKSVLFVPLVSGRRATGVISLQNVDREHAFSESDLQLLETLAGSLSVALENARLVNETRQRVSELGTVNSVGQALASQLELDGLIELVGERVRETFEADIAYVALHDEPAGAIEFAYYWESGERRPEPALRFGEGLTSQILASREPLLLNRKDQLEKQVSLGTPSLSYLGVPIMVGARAIGAISVQSTREAGLFGEADVRLLATIAANVGVAIQNARLFAEVERQRQYLNSLIAISPAAVVVMDTDEIVIDWNPAAAELFGYSAEEALGRHVDELVFGETGREEGREIIAEAMQEGRAQRITRRRRRDGTLIDAELMLVPLTVDGSHAGFLGVYHDVTELQRARQEAEAATQAKSAFLATMSHEIRTPMNAVIGMTDLLLATALTGEQREFAEVVHSSGDALLHVIDDILDYSKIEAGKLDLERQPFRLRDCVEGALDIVAPRAWEKGIELGCLIDEAAPAGVLGDEARLRQVLLNLLSNGVKFTEEAGEVVVLVQAESSGPRSYGLELSVRDTGIGIPPDRMDRLFTSFSQVDASTTRRFGGTGLGLAISKRLVELMGGTISVESEQGSGSTFRISLPVTSADVPSPIPLEEGLPQLAGKRILIVDDNATNREIVTRHSRSWGMEPVATEFPAEALALVEAGEAFDVAVLDMMMPGMDGLALAGEIRVRRSAEELPLLLLTSLGRIPQAESGSVFSAQLAKPLKASQLYNTLLRLLAGGMDEEETAETAGEGKQARSTLRILLAEDNPMNQKVALRLLERLGYSADVVWNGLEALAALEGRPYDVVLMDVQMPELDGLDATRRICERWEPESRPHIIAMTANALPEDREACFAAGMNDYVAKPIRAEELAAALKRVRPVAANNDGIPEGADMDLDAAALRNLRDLGGDEFLAEVVDTFLADAPQLMSTLRRSLEEQNPEELRRAAHTLKSNGATLGAESFAELCRTLEQHAKEGRLDGAGDLVTRIEQAYGPLEESLGALRAEQAS